jgi:hypothetical protein
VNGRVKAVSSAFRPVNGKIVLFSKIIALFYKMFCILVKKNCAVMQLDFEIDKLTYSLEEVQIGKSYKTEVLPLSKNDMKYILKKGRLVV